MNRFAIFFLKTPAGQAITEAEAQELMTLLSLFYKEFNKASYPEKADVLRAYMRIIKVKMEGSEKNIAQTDKTNSKDYRHYEKFILMLERDVFRVRKIEYYSNKIGMTTRKLSAICRLFCNKSARELIDERLIAEAKRMLRDSSSPVKEIAMHLGFSDQYQFSKYFKKHNKVSPANYRKKFV